MLSEELDTRGSRCAVLFLKSGLTGFHPPAPPEATMAFPAAGSLKPVLHIEDAILELGGAKI
jgi:hypothetical protein